MKQLSAIASAVALTAGLLASTQASALTICDNCVYTAAGATYLGAHDSSTFDGSGFRRRDIAVTTPTFVTDTWLFTLDPFGAAAQINANFIPISPAAFSGFTLNLYEASFSCPTVGNALGTSGYCPGATLGALKGTAVSTGAAADLFPVSLTAGQYAFVITYTANVLSKGETAEYSGQLRVRPLPEPGSLALAGLALIGVAASMRRSRKA